MSPAREQEFDGPWKNALEGGFDLFLALFLPDLHALVDWTQDHRALDQELQKLMPESATGVRRVDKLFQAARQGSDSRFFHVEAQAQPQPEEEFGERMYVYSYRGRDLLGQPLISIALLTDDQLSWHPRQHREGEHGSELVFTFRTVKLLEWAERQPELEAGANVFGLFASAHLEALQTRDDPDRRAKGKIRLLSNLVSRELPDDEKWKWWGLIDWILPLPQDQERRVWQQVRSFREGKPMTFVPFVVREARELGIEEGREQGRAEGREQGRAEGREQGERDALLRTLRAALKGKFGEEGEVLLAQLPEQTPLARLEELAVQVSVATVLDTLRPHFAQG
jgi:hypothetical protein